MSRSDVMSHKCNVFLTTAEQLEEIQLAVFFVSPHVGTKSFEILLKCMLEMSKCYVMNNLIEID